MVSDLPSALLSLNLQTGIPVTVEDSEAATGLAQQADNTFSSILSGLRRTDRGALFEPARTNINYPSNLEDALWQKSNLPTVTLRESIIPGLDAWEYVSNGSTGILSSPGSVYGNFASQLECLWAIVETTATTGSFFMQVEDTDAGSAAVLSFTASNMHLDTPTLTVNTGSASNELTNAIFLGEGPNGGRLWLFVIQGTPTTTGRRRTRLRPNFNTPAVGTSIIVHHFQYEVGGFATSPIVATSGAASRDADAVTIAIADGTYDIKYTLFDGTVHDRTGVEVSGGALAIPTDLYERLPITTSSPPSNRLTNIRVGYVTKIEIWEPSDGVHIIGDSFVEGPNTLSMWLPVKGHRPRDYSFDGVSGSSLSQEATRFDGTPEHYGKLLVILDGGLNGDETLEGAITAINDMVAHLTTDPVKWLYIQSFPNGVEGNEVDSTYYDNYLAINAGLLAEYPDNYVATLTKMQSFGDGSENDLSDIANGWIPRSMTLDGLHPNNLGVMRLTEIIADAIRSKGW